MNQYHERIELLRSFMRVRDIDAVIIYGSDPHMSEYPAPRWACVNWLTGFTGEAGDVVVTLEHAGLWTDSRYFIQAQEQLLGTTVQLHKTRVPQAVSIEDWLESELGRGVRVAIDSLCTSLSQYKTLCALFEVQRIPNLMSSLWEDRPIAAQTPLFLIESGESRAQKLAWLRSEMAKKGCEYFFVSALDQIAWLLNVRASDIEYNPMSISYLLISQQDAIFFMLRDSIEEEDTELSIQALAADGVQTVDYEQVAVELASIQKEAKVWVDGAVLNAELYSVLSCKIYDAPSPIELRKAVKNAYEIENMRLAHINDGLAVEKFLYWLEKSLDMDRELSEWDASCKLGEFRAQISDYVGDSFETISACGAGAALPHYHTPRMAAPLLPKYGLYLNDSGGQFLSGTTDITRTVPLGECTDLERREYTMVLKAHIDLASALFPKGTPGCRVDAACRMALWREKLDFGHGTGHGVGYFLGVHEGPTQIRQNVSASPLLEGMITSIEPGIYREGLFGVRHENLYLCVDAGSSEFGSFLRFEPLTMCHFDTSILDKSLLDSWEIEWLNNYHKRVYETLSPLMEEDMRQWLEQKTKAI